MIQLRGVSKRLGSKQVLDGLDLEIPTGITTVILGRRSMRVTRIGRSSSGITPSARSS